MTANQILVALKGRYRQPGWAAFSELAVGLHSTRIDFYALHTQPGGPGFRSLSCEIKVTRSDFAHELDAPQKRTVAEEVSHETWFVVPWELVQADEVPEGWGLLWCREADLNLFEKKRAMQRKLELLPLWFVAAIARRGQEHQPTPEERIRARLDGKELSSEELEQAVRKAFNAEVKAAEARARQKAEIRLWETEELLALRAFRDSVGKRLGTRARTVEGFEAALEGKVLAGTSDWRVRRMAQDLRANADALDALLGTEQAA